MTDRPIIKIEFLGDGLEPTTVLDVIYAHSDQTGMGLRGPEWRLRRSGALYC